MPVPCSSQDGFSRNSGSSQVETVCDECNSFVLPTSTPMLGLSSNRAVCHIPTRKRKGFFLVRFLWVWLE